MTTPTDAEIILEAIRSRLLDVHTALPGKVVSYDASAQTANIQPMINRSILNDKDEVVNETLPQLPDIPVAFPRGNDFFISFPLKAGDHVMVIFSEASLDSWKAQGSSSVPINNGDIRRHSLTGGIAVPCLYPDTDALSDAHADDMVMGKDGTNAQVIVTDGDEIHLGKSSSKEAARKGDTTVSGATMSTWVSAVTVFINGLVPLTVVQPTDFGIVDSGSATVKIRD